MNYIIFYINSVKDIKYQKYIKYQNYIKKILKKYIRWNKPIPTGI